MNEILFQVTVNGEPYCDPMGVTLKNAFVHALNKVVDNVDFIEIKEYPKLRLLEGGRK